MNFDFTDEQEQLRDAVRKWVDKSYTFDRRRSIEATGGFSKEAFDELNALGLGGLIIDEAFDGLGMGPVEAMVVMEELGRGIVLEPYTQTLIASGILTNYASDDIKKEWLPKIASSEAFVVLAYQERSARYRLEQCAAQASKSTASGDSYALNAIKSMVPAGDHTSAWIVPAMLDGRMALFLVERDAEGTKAVAYGTQNGGRAAELSMSNTPAVLLTKDGLSALEWGVDIGIAATCAEAVGAMDKLVALTVEYMNTRKQFGVNISSFQALRHRMADIKMQLELARSMSYYATLKVNAPAAERRAAMARAKYQLGLSMRFVGQQAVQLHGGIGVTDEYAGSHYFKHLTQLEMTFGDTLHHLALVSNNMQETAGVFA